MPLEPVYPILYLDVIVVKISDGHHVKNKATHIAVGMDLEGIKHVLGTRVQETEGAKFWAGICAELANHGFKDVQACGGGENVGKRLGPAYPVPGAPAGAAEGHLRHERDFVAEFPATENHQEPRTLPNDMAAASSPEEPVRESDIICTLMPEITLYILLAPAYKTRQLSTAPPE